MAQTLKQANLTVTLNGETFTIPFNNAPSLLEAALDHGYDAPFACQIGACCTCRAKLTVGRVVMEEREALSDEEIEQGYILTCQSKPLTDELVYSYDE